MIEIATAGDPAPVACFDEREPGLTRHDYPRYAFSVPEAARFGASAVARDLARIAVALFLADRQVRRSVHSGYRSRRFTVTIPLEEPARWEGSRERLEDLADFTSQDQWRLRFRRLPAALRTPFAAPAREAGTTAPTVVALFSGGLDSLCGAAYLAQKRGEHPVFVTHSPPGHERARKLLQETFALLHRDALPDEHVIGFAVRPHQQDRDGVRTFFQEPTRRTRPFLFLALAAATAVALGVRRVQMSENGALGLSLPMRRSHYGPRMTRQGHGFLMDGLREVMDQVAPGPTPWAFENPFAGDTKGESCAQLNGAEPVAAKTLSCEYGGQQAARLQRWQREVRGRRRAAEGVRQCGLCVPCLVRRAALRRARIPDGDDAYFFSARDTLRALRAGRDPVLSPRRGRPPPLYAFVRAHALYVARFAEEIAAMKIEDFAVQYFPELRAARPRLANAAAMGAVFAVQQRFARELLEFLI